MNLLNLIQINRNDKFFVDTNILIFLFSPSFVTSEEWQISKYSQIFSKLVEQENEIYINSHVISEFINLCLRMDYNKNFNKDNNKNFKKDYRKSEDYKNTMKIILSELKKILKLVIIINDDLVKFDIFDEYQKNIELDFNDLIIAHTTIKNSLMLLSDDNDFDNYTGIKRFKI